MFGKTQVASRAGQCGEAMVRNGVGVGAGDVYYAQLSQGIVLTAHSRASGMEKLDCKVGGKKGQEDGLQRHGGS